MMPWNHKLNRYKSQVEILVKKSKSKWVYLELTRRKMYKFK